MIWLLVLGFIAAAIVGAAGWLSYRAPAAARLVALVAVPLAIWGAVRIGIVGGWAAATVHQPRGRPASHPSKEETS